MYHKMVLLYIAVLSEGPSYISCLLRHSNIDSNRFCIHSNLAKWSRGLQYVDCISIAFPQMHAPILYINMYAEDCAANPNRSIQIKLHFLLHIFCLLLWVYKNLKLQLNSWNESFWFCFDILFFLIFFWGGGVFIARQCWHFYINRAHFVAFGMYNLKWTIL